MYLPNAPGRLLDRCSPPRGGLMLENYIGDVGAFAGGKKMGPSGQVKLTGNAIETDALACGKGRNSSYSTTPFTKQGFFPFKH